MRSRTPVISGPYVDIHCHLLAGLDDGPATLDESLEMCSVAASRGTCLIFATAHQGGRFAGLDPDSIRRATERLKSSLSSRGLDLEIVPSAEVVLECGIADLISRGRRLTVADRGRHVLIEFPSGFGVSAQEELSAVIDLGITPILAHPERYSCLTPPGALEELVALGCLAQVNASSFERRGQVHSRVLSWLRSGLVHYVASDGHSPKDRPPLLAPAFSIVASEAGLGNALRLFHLNGMALARGRPPLPPQPVPSQSWWTSLLENLKLRSPQAS